MIEGVVQGDGDRVHGRQFTVYVERDVIVAVDCALDRLELSRPGRGYYVNITSALVLCFCACALICARSRDLLRKTIKEGPKVAHVQCRWKIDHVLVHRPRAR